jgi:hypothetical protein
MDQIFSNGTSQQNQQVIICRYIVNGRGQYVMEEWLHFAETIAPLVLPPGTLLAAIRIMWHLLRPAIIHYMRALHFMSGTYRFTPAACNAAASKLLAYPKPFEQAGCPTLFQYCLTYVMHVYQSCSNQL